MYRLNDVIILNERKDYILSLPPKSNKIVKKVCPLCKEEKQTAFCHITEVGHTYCRRCSAAVSNMKSIIGKTFGRLIVIDFAKPYVGKDGKRYSRVECQCSCGKTKAIRVAELKRGEIVSCGCRVKETGEKSSGWNPKITKEVREKYKRDRKYNANIVWKKAVKEKYENKCFACGGVKKIVVHHLESFRDNEDLRLDINNGVCLCETCHKDYHLNFMGGYKKGATTQSFMEWIKCR